MAKTLTYIENVVKFFGRDKSISLTSAANLPIVNNLYRSLATLFPWPESRQTHTIDNTVSGSAEYSWLSTTTATLVEKKSFEVGTTATDATFNFVMKPPSEPEWCHAEGAGVPVYYMQYAQDTLPMVELRPAPNYTGGTIRVTATVEPTDLVNGNSVTIFNLSSADDALAFMIGAAFATRDGIADLVEYNTKLAIDILRNIFSREEVPEEMVTNIIGSNG